MFESVKGSLLAVVPYERDILYEKMRERRRNGCKVSDEWTLITCKTPSTKFWTTVCWLWGKGYVCTKEGRVSGFNRMWCIKGSLTPSALLGKVTAELCLKSKSRRRDFAVEKSTTLTWAESWKKKWDQQIMRNICLRRNKRNNVWRVMKGPTVANFKRTKKCTVLERVTKASVAWSQTKKSVFSRANL